MTQNAVMLSFYTVFNLVMSQKVINVTEFVINFSHFGSLKAHERCFELEYWFRQSSFARSNEENSHCSH